MADHNFSIEFFPPKTAEGTEKLRATRAKLAELDLNQQDIAGAVAWARKPARKTRK